MTRSQWLDRANKALRGTEAPRRTAELLLCSVLNIDRVALLCRPDSPLPSGATAILDNLLARRLTGEPVAYLLGFREFYGRDFEVSPHTLIPRPDTECLVNEALSRLPEHGVRFADFGTGSGCLAVTLAAERPGWRGTALDVDEEALCVARRNAERLEVADRLQFLCADFTRPGFWEPGSVALHLVVSNPPYVTEEEYAGLEPEVREYEPRTALVPGPVGLEHLEAVAEAAGRILRGDGLLIMEHGYLQGEAVRSLFTPARWKEAMTGQDLAGRDRYVVAVHR